MELNPDSITNVITLSEKLTNLLNYTAKRFEEIDENRRSVIGQWIMIGSTCFTVCYIFWKVWKSIKVRGHHRYRIVSHE